LQNNKLVSNAEEDKKTDHADNKFNNKLLTKKLIGEELLLELASAEASQEPDAIVKPEDASVEDSADAEDAA